PYTWKPTGNKNDMPTSILALLDEIRAIGQLGIHYAENPFDRERYERLLRMASQEYAAISGLPENDVDALFRRELGYITPKVGCNGAVFNPQGHVLLVKRSDNGRWGLPGGYAEVNLSPQDNCRREMWEETGLEVEVGDLVDVFHALPGQYDQPNTIYILLFLCTVTGGTLTPSHETPIVGFYDHTTITDWHTNHADRVDRAYKYWIKHYRL
ncbi:MAG: NUDIX hydrolase N-terminal domain-containing protein, partial [Anaerolineae bacterium]|nr:NUDIX hydrolase N-terminal domain-containing protein [Anaerolineae bacterium]